jgi:hypothetical protein
MNVFELRDTVIYATAAGVDRAGHAVALLETAGDPWIRLDQRYQPQGSLTEDADTHVVWVGALGYPTNLDSHYAMLRSGWEGAKAFLSQPGNPEYAQAVSHAARSEISARGGIRTGGPTD